MNGKDLFVAIILCQDQAQAYPGGADKRLYTLAVIVLGHHFPDDPYGARKIIQSAYTADRHSGLVMGCCSQIGHQCNPVALCQAETDSSMTGGKPGIGVIGNETIPEFGVHGGDVALDVFSINVDTAAGFEGFWIKNQSPVQ